MPPRTLTEGFFWYYKTKTAKRQKLLTEIVNSDRKSRRSYFNPFLIKNAKKEKTMKEGLIIVGVIVALVFTFMGYHQTKLVSDRVSSLEQNMGLLIKSAQEKQAMKDELSRDVEKIEKNAKTLTPEEAIPIIEKVTDSLIKIIRATKEENVKNEEVKKE